MEVTSRLKRRFASEIVLQRSYAQSLEQTFRFPLDRPELLAELAEDNRLSVRDFVRHLGNPDRELSDRQGPVWRDVPAGDVVHFLRDFRTDERTRSISLPAANEYILRMREVGELTEWIVAVRGRGTRDTTLGAADWGLPDGPIAQVSRSRLRSNPQSLGVIVDPDDEAIGLVTPARGRNARAQRRATQGLLLLYPISRWSGHDAQPGSNRQALFTNPRGPLARDLVGLAISFPGSEQPQVVDAYIRGTVEWRSVG